MALDQSALLEVLEAVKLADVDDRVRSATETLYQALIEAELTATLTGIEPAWPAWKAWDSRLHLGRSAPSRADAVPSACLTAR